MKKFISLFAVIVLLFTGCTNSGTIKGENMKLVKDGKAHYIQLKDIIIDKNVNLKNTLKKEEFVLKEIKNGKAKTMTYFDARKDEKEIVLEKESEQAYIYFGAPFYMKSGDEEAFKAKVASFILWLS